MGKVGRLPKQQGMKNIYIRKRGRDTWHWARCCPYFQGFEEQGLFRTWVAGQNHFVSPKRPRGDLCNTCKAIERKERQPGR